MVTTNKEITTYKKLSIQVSLNGLSFCILDEISKEIIYYKRINFPKQQDPVKVLSQIELTYEQESELNKEVDEVGLIFTNPLFSLVPLEYFDEENAASYLKFNTRILKTDFIAFDTIKQEITNIYIPYTNIVNYFFDRYGEFEYRHSLSVLIDTLLDSPTQTKEPRMYLHAYEKHYDLVVIENSKLVLANSFEYDTKEDFLYYILFTAEQLNMNPDKFELIFLGDITKESEEYKMAWNYIRNITFMGPFHQYSFSNSAEVRNELSEFLLIKSL